MMEEKNYNLIRKSKIGNSQSILYGSCLQDGIVPDCTNPKILLQGSCRQEEKVLGFSEEILSRNILCVGGIGSGKTNAINQIVGQLKKNLKSNDVMIIFDTKGDYQRHFFSPEANDVLVGGSFQYQAKTEIWNLFSDILPEPRGLKKNNFLKINCDEVAMAIFERNKSTQQPFFANAAESIFSACLMAIIRNAYKDMGESENINFQKYNNAMLEPFIQKILASVSSKTYQSHTDLNIIYQYLGNGESNQALGVISELLLGIRRIFSGFFSESGSFSVRKFIKEKGGRTLFLEYDPTLGNALDPAYTLFIDMALKEALGRIRTDGNVYVILDEFRMLPHMQHLDHALNFGRELGLKIIAGLQTVYQLYEEYGEYQAKSILAGFGTLFAFRPNDSATREFIRDYFGKNIGWETYMRGGTPHSDAREGNCVEDWEINALHTGEAVIGIVSHPPFPYYFNIF